MTTITSSLLNDTLTLIQLARETSRIQGQTEKAEKLSPLVEDLKNLASDARETKPASAVKPSSGMMGQEDFKTLLSTIQHSKETDVQKVAGLSFSSSTERNNLISAMARGGMGSLEIARQMGLTLDEVTMVVTLNQSSGVSEE